MVSYWVLWVLVFYRLFFLNIFCSVDFGVVAVLQPCFGSLSFGRCSGALNGWSLVNAICGMRVFFRFGSSGNGEVGFFLFGACSFWVLGGGALVAAVCRDMGIYGFLWLAVDLKKKTKLGYISWDLGVVWVFHSLGVRVGWHFCPVDMRTGLCSFLALGWCLDGGDLGCGRGAVVIWGFGEWSKKKLKFIL